MESLGRTRATLFAGILALAACSTPQAAPEDHSPARRASRPADLVDVFIGTAAHGHTFPGATVPFGMVQLSPDTRSSGWDNCSGYHSSNPTILGFSHNHLSGTGCADLGDILFAPTQGPLQLEPGSEEKPESGYRSRFRTATESAHPGYYSVTLDDDGIRAELSATERCGIHRYTFSKAGDGNIIIDLRHGLEDRTTDSEVHVLGDREISGWRRSTGWARDERIYFCARFSRPFTSFGTARDGHRVDGARDARGENIVGYVTFADAASSPVIVKVGLSYVDEQGARKNLDREIQNFDFDEVARRAFDVWNRELGKIEVSGGRPEDLVKFYTALYHCFLAPNLFADVDGRFRAMDGNISNDEDARHYHVFSLWDTFRALHPLFTLVQPERNREFVHTLQANKASAGTELIWELCANETNCMIGSHGYAVLADALAKDPAVLATTAASAGSSHALQEERREIGLIVRSPTPGRRFANPDFTRLGYIPADRENEAVSKTLEYCYNSWNLYAILGDSSPESAALLRRAKSYIHSFDASTGFFRAKKNGGWTEPFDPREVSGYYTEANAWQYNFFVPHDVSGLIALHGGDAKFIQKLDGLFTTPSALTGRAQADITGLIGQYAHGNEPSHHVAYLYSYAGAPAKTSERVRQICDTLYKNSRDGLCGNDDCGQMSAWYVLSAMGFYPVCPGNSQYTLGAPSFEEVRIHTAGGPFTIRAGGASSENIYIQSAKLDGRPYEKLYLDHATLTRGGTLDLQMGPSPAPSVDRWERPRTSLPGEFVMIPFFRTAGRSFVDSMDVGMGCYTAGADIYYTTDGSEPTQESTRYKDPLVLRESAIVKARAFKPGFVASPVESVEFTKLPFRRTVKYKYPYSPLYTAGGEYGLVDGLRASKDSHGEWQGFEGTDMDVLVDLGAPRPVRRIAATFLQDYKSWIFLPTQAEVLVSNDGLNFESRGIARAPFGPEVKEPRIGRYEWDMQGTSFRYVKLIAKTLATCPPGHPGEGGKCWIFADEIEMN
jgi:predicted alpha-1,2-mannosidase